MTVVTEPYGPNILEDQRYVARRALTESDISGKVKRFAPEIKMPLKGRKEVLDE